MVRKDYTLDDCAAFDYPAAINKVIEITKQVYKPLVLVKVANTFVFNFFKMNTSEQHKATRGSC